MDRGALIFIFAILLAIVWSAGQGGLGTSSMSSLGPKVSFYTPPKTTPKDERGISNELNKIKNATDQIQTQIDEANRAAVRSDLSNDISFYNGNGGSTNPNTEYLTFSLSSAHKGKVLISGFELRSTATGKSVTIPKGVDLPFAGVLNEENLIFISPGDKVTIVTGRSPTGYSFKLNECTGYFAQFQKFTPALPLRCPLPADEKLPSAPNNVSDTCLDFLNSISRCTMPISNYQLSQLDSQCYTFVTEQLNYKSCILNHQKDPDFYSHEWRVYLGQDAELWKSRREVIELLDLNKKVVGTITY